MVCFGRTKYQFKERQKWEYLNLKDFKVQSVFEPLSYIWVWILSFGAVAVYVLDTFTAVKLLRFNEWSSIIPSSDFISFTATKWIFSGCIICSWVLCFYEWFRAYRVMQLDSIAEDYLDPLAVVLQTIRIPSGWKRFLVFAELTKSTHKAAWVAFFVYFQRKGCVRHMAAEGPRMAVNALNLYQFSKNKNLLDAVAGQNAVGGFFTNLKLLLDSDRDEAVVLLAMAVTLVIWIFNMIFLIAAILMWIFFISCYIKNETLTGYCRRKVEKRLAKLIIDKTDKAWESEQKKREKQEQKLKSKGALVADDDLANSLKKQPTLPAFGTFADSTPTLPSHTSKPEDELPHYPLSRQDTKQDSYSAGASLLGNAGAMSQDYPPYSRSNTNDPKYPPSLKSAQTSSIDRRYSPPNNNYNNNNNNNNNHNNTSWRGRTSSDQEDEQSYEMQQPTLPSALMTASGSRSNTTLPGSSRGQFPPSSLNNLPRSMTPGGPPSSSSVRSMTPSGPPPFGPANRPNTPGNRPMDRSMTPGSHASRPPNQSFSNGPPRRAQPGLGSMDSGYGTPNVPLRNPRRSTSNSPPTSPPRAENGSRNGYGQPGYQQVYQQQGYQSRHNYGQSQDSQQSHGQNQGYQKVSQQQNYQSRHKYEQSQDSQQSYGQSYGQGYGQGYGQSNQRRPQQNNNNTNNNNW